MSKQVTAVLRQEGPQQELIAAVDAYLGMLNDGMPDWGLRVKLARSRLATVACTWRAALSASRTAQEGQQEAGITNLPICQSLWLPIASAPKTGQPIVLGFLDNPSKLGFWSQQKMEWLRLGAASPTTLAPTHWMQLPSGPALPSSPTEGEREDK